MTQCEFWDGDIRPPYPRVTIDAKIENVEKAAKMIAKACAIKNAVRRRIGAVRRRIGEIAYIMHMPKLSYKIDPRAAGGMIFERELKAYVSELEEAGAFKNAKNRGDD